MAILGIKHILETVTYVVAIMGGIGGAYVYFENVRKESIETTREEIVRAWTNEGDIKSAEKKFITLELENHDGDISGSLLTNTQDNPLEVHADIGWFSTTLKISELRWRNVVPIATVKIMLEGNNNRLEWRLIENDGLHLLPKQTVLWPSPVGVER